MTRTITPTEVVLHLDQITWLFNDIASVYNHNQRMSWEHVATLERRVESHLNQLRASWATTCTVAAQHIERYYDTYTYTAAIYVLASGEPDQPGLDIVLNALAKAPDEAVNSYNSMLQRATHPALALGLGALMDHPRPLVRACAIGLLGFRREGNPQHIARWIDDPDERVRTAAVIACSDFGYRDIVPQVEQRAGAHGALRSDIALALLLLGSERVLHAFRVDIGKHLERASAINLTRLAMCADVRDAEALLVAHTRNKINAYPALMMLGDTNTIPYLLDDLNSTSERVRKLAHQTLKYITAAEVKVPNYSLWLAWWRRNTARFSQHPRWRWGRPWTLKICIDTLAAPGMPYLQRRDAYLELVIRSGHIIHFESSWEISRQREAIKQWQAWWEQEQHRFIDKPWPYAGR